LIDNIAAADAVCVARLRGAGAIVLSKLSTHEFAIGGPNFDLPWPPARNQWNTAYHPGGSSSGSGSGVAAGLFPIALGGDTGGSVRNPASACGIVGLKPTYGLVSRRGVFPLSFTLDHVGPLTRTVTDNALMLDVIAGHDPLDPGSVAETAGALRPHRAKLGHRQQGDRAQRFLGVHNLGSERQAPLAANRSRGRAPVSHPHQFGSPG
jgi:aspartyl-tRNA(Asn)/glutamyl-tRNA(Gln) amidotransferase subunit A